MTTAATRDWDAGHPIDLAGTLLPLRRGTGDPSHRLIDGRFWWACLTPEGEGTIALSAHGSVVSATAWGDGAEWLLERGPVLCGRDDDWSGLDVTRHPVLERSLRTHPGLRLCATGLVFDSLVPAILEQKVTGAEARCSWRNLLRWYGTPAPGPTPRPMWVPPTPRRVLAVPSWDWHRLGVDLRRQRAIRAAASVAHRLEDSTSSTVLERLRTLPGIGEWTAAETAQRAFGHPDAVSVGDYHLKNWVAFALTGEPRGTDERMLELLAPWAGQRQRIMRLIEAGGAGAPRFGPRFSPNDIRAI